MVVAQMLQRNDWRLLNAVDLTRRIMALLRNRQPAQTAAQPRSGDPVAGVALRCYSEALYSAFAGFEGEERQRRAYVELLRYISGVLNRKAAALSRDEREELAYETITELYYRTVAEQRGLPEKAIRVPGALLAIALQQSRNALHRWQHAAHHVQQYGAAVGEIAHAVGDSLETAPLSSEDDLETQTERREHIAQVRACFKRTLERYPRARLQLYAVWLHIVEEQAYTTIADMLEMSVANARVLCCRGLDRLRNDREWQALAAEDSLPNALEMIRFPARRTEFQRGQDHE
jgi:DNA-directed RNA polymerase specialized sigma24 family protein